MTSGCLCFHSEIGSKIIAASKGLGVEVHVFRRLRQGDHEFKVSLRGIESLCLKSKEPKEERGGRKRGLRMGVRE